MDAGSGLRPSSRRKRDTILREAEAVFVRDGYAAAGVDVIAERSGVAKQTIYTHFGDKQGLFVAVATSAATGAFDAVHLELPQGVSAAELPGVLEHYGVRQLEAVLDTRVLGLRRLAIAEAHRFPALGRAFWTSGPERALDLLRTYLAGLDRRGLLDVADPAVAATTFNWLIMAAPLNAVMMLGDDQAPGPDERAVIAAEAVRVFLAAYGPPQRSVVVADERSGR